MPFCVYFGEGGGMLKGNVALSLHCCSAVTAHGEAWTWGDGKGGKLGHGTAQHVHSPHRVESLVGRAAVRQVALGDTHTLFVDQSGGLWACGENKEGQCGLGTPLEVIATQHRRAFYDTFRALKETVAAEPRASREQRARQAIHSLMSAPGSGSPAHTTHSSYGHGSGAVHQHQWGPDRTASGWRPLAAAGRGGGGGSGDGIVGVSVSGARSSLHFGGLDFEGAFAGSGIQPGQQATPLRIGRDQHPLWAAAAAAAAATGTTTPMTMGHGGVDASMRVVLPSGLEREIVVGVAASKYFSAALTEAGEVWTFGACYNGSLGSHSSWSTSAQKVSGSLAAVLEDSGGARRVVSGGSFCAALTASGRVVVWGKVPGGETEGGSSNSAEAGSSSTVDSGSGSSSSGGSSRGCSLGLTERGVDIVQGGRVVVGVIPDLPPILHIAAGLQHLLLSDGHRVWMVGRTLDASGAVASTASWRRPNLVLTLPVGDAVRQLVAGMHSSAVVSELGEVWIWGRLLDRHHADSIARRHPNLAYDSSGDGGVAGGDWPTEVAPPRHKDDVLWHWPGFGGKAPAKLDGLGGPVRALALGGWHALAVVE
ncbi:hypothetical protein VOLCADRAFT_85945 [Volvox carteri f. nagariensis]|uniref:Uncharacterized protein n=1 Tax=Volvox carteri f. nagariensis TaxID=3068 RepID=D8THE8_VOLCA|nr:uncharacterized protein VOLCADRAFT_85945 [Volvox carteri f. nagariensis]EFJ52699.1 hypothetical protein VOLCADRAFT_85945 [Volvox carteri f. nagariensis]|eukprot:XP_002945704.1 hypothetical protein VOLCADRAFT_85945 [Volvox carteri f. nagariensis]